MRRQLNVGLFGFGCVGQGLYNVKQISSGWNANLKKICIKNENKERSLPQELFTTCAEDILDDPDINVVVELTNDTEAAFEIVKKALSKGKAVISANKKMIAENLPELYKLQQKFKRPFLYEGACCASIPIIRNLEEYYDNDLLYSVEGIFNGSTNYILTKLAEEGLSFEEALKDAQRKGFAESDPRLDVEGIDPKLKLSILMLHAFGTFINPSDILHSGIQYLNRFDFNFAKQRGFKIKLIASCRKWDNNITGWCLPAFVPQNDKLAKVDNEYNGIIVGGAFTEFQYFEGKGAGGNPTGSAVLSDLSALSYDYKYEYRKYLQNSDLVYTTNFELNIYLRFHSKIPIQENDFTSISGKYEAGDVKYITGRIPLNRISKYLNMRDLSLILLPDRN